MTEKEAIEIIKNFPKWNLDDQWLDEDEMQYLSEMVISALEEIQQYRALGPVEQIEEQMLLTAADETILREYKELGFVEELREAKEKQRAKTPYMYGDGYDNEGNMIYDMYECPNCGESYEIDGEKYDFCPNCGQAIEWSWEENV